MFGRNLIRSLAINSKLKVLGTCFGHQFMSYLYGGVVQKRKFIKGPESVTFYKSNESESLPFM
jgi:GMP synthase-like glutamine amidotransferase